MGNFLPFLRLTERHNQQPHHRHQLQQQQQQSQRQQQRQQQQQQQQQQHCSTTTATTTTATVTTAAATTTTAAATTTTAAATTTTAAATATTITATTTTTTAEGATTTAALTEKPWRATKDWNNRVRCELKEDIVKRAPQTRGKLDVKFFNIVLTGQIGAGKSSFINSVNGIFQEEPTGARAEVGYSAKSLTQEYCVYEVYPKETNNEAYDPAQPLSWRICDTMGLQQDKCHDVANILQAVAGHVPDGFKFPDEEVDENTPGYIPSPQLQDRAHCVAVVVDIKGVLRLMGDNVMKTKLQTLRKGLIDKNIPTYILLTHIDEVCVEVKRDVTKVYRSIAIRDLVDKVSKILVGLPQNHIFPVMNYKEQIDLDDNMDILLLYALRQMLRNAQGHLDNKMKSHSGQGSLHQTGRTEKTTSRGDPVMQPTS